MRKISLILDTGQPHEVLIIENNVGDVANQEFWEGKPRKLVGFVKNKTWKVIDVDHQTFYDNPFLAVGKYPVFTDNDEEWYVAHNLVKETEIVEE